MCACVYVYIQREREKMQEKVTVNQTTIIWTKEPKKYNSVENSVTSKVCVMAAPNQNKICLSTMSNYPRSELKPKRKRKELEILVQFGSRTGKGVFFHLVGGKRSNLDRQEPEEEEGYVC